ncbi:cysteine dioxygenase family protein [Fictibacillus nanhaiensis]|uniref:cysteine dioxygenase n=1 Tax=Fictibacillus nanhaiensis TaxID=742169 RepID=UPI001C9879CB|nr:cysteine dioxygenase family protein [Fictibacillus nanhaiensis]MBY6035762.1 cysteine dioxygenase family protein [Fictibacillus nanhaiensis]
MMINQKAQHVLDSLNKPSKPELKKALLNLHMKLEDVEPILKSAEGKPYYRKLLYQNEDVELLVMNWSELECAPHDHGNSHGWIQVLTGSSLNSVYEVKENGLPSELFEEIHQKGKFFYAPIKGVHKMKAAGGKDLVTLHLYSPPISGMMVYDLKKCAACVVSDDCGAWWPEEQHKKIKEIQLSQNVMTPE